LMYYLLSGDKQRIPTRYKILHDFNIINTQKYRSKKERMSRIKLINLTNKYKCLVNKLSLINNR
jgi:hypothetical protein